MLLSGIGRRKVHILRTKRHSLLLICLIYILLQLINVTQCSLQPADKNFISTKIKANLQPATGRKSVVYGLASPDWARRIEKSQINTNSRLLRIINSKVDNINENLKRVIRALKPNNHSEFKGSNIPDYSSAQIDFVSNNVSVSNSANIFGRTNPAEETEIALSPGEELTDEISGDTHTNKTDEPEPTTNETDEPKQITNETDEPKQTTNETLTDPTETIRDGTTLNLTESTEHASELITSVTSPDQSNPTETILHETTRNLTESKEDTSELIISTTSPDQSNVSNETSSTTQTYSIINESSENIDTSSDFDNSTPPRNDASNKFVPTISADMAQDPDLNEQTQQPTNFSNSQEVTTQPDAPTQQKPLISSTMSVESSTTSVESSTTPEYQSDSSSMLIEEILKTVTPSTSFAINKSTSSSQVRNLNSGYTLKRILLQGIDRINFSLDEHVIKLPQSKADLYVFYYIPGTMNLHRSGDYLYLPNEHKHYGGGYLKHQYTQGKSSDDYSAHSLDHHKLMHEYAKSKQNSASEASHQTSNGLSVNMATGDEKPKVENSPEYYFIAPYFHGNRTFGHFRLSNPKLESVQVQTNKSVDKTGDEPRNENDGDDTRHKRDTKRFPNFPDSAIKNDCSGDVKRCADGTCIRKKKWCDQIIDCLDKSDELNCSCRDRMDAKKICDSYVDCPDGEDEKGCSGCPEKTFSCYHEIRQRIECVPMDNRCDGIVDCSDGSDETDCELLTDTVDFHETLHTSYTSGYLHRNHRGIWYPACIEIHSEHLWGVQACRAELGVNVKHVEAELLLFPGNYAGKFITHGPTGPEFIDTCIYPGYAVHVKCPSIPCGSRIRSTHHLSGTNHYRSKRMVQKDFKKELVVKLLQNLYGKTYANALENEERPGRVVGGTESHAGDWPWLIALYRDGELHCGGAVIDETWILTAGHCVYQYKSHYYEVYAGRLRRFSFSPHEQLRIVTHVIIHPEYNHEFLKNDLALLKLQEPLKFNRWVRPICLPVDRPPWGPVTGTVCNAAGWGSLWERGSKPDTLQEVRLPIRPKCKNQADKDGEEICAGYEQGGFDTCQGDSGGPLMCNLHGAHDQWYVAGVVSHGDGCARAHEPGAYTRVALFIPWIIAHTDNKFLTPARQSSPRCPFMKCAHGGRCVGIKKIGDGVVDCLSAEDEIVERKFYEDRILPTYVDDFRGWNHKIGNTDAKLLSLVDMLNNLDQSRSAQNLQSTSQVKESVDGVSNGDALSNSEDTLNDDPTIEKRETPSYFTCKNLPQNIPLALHCDTEVDCEDGTDEINCSCADYLKVTNESLICDGIIHCYDLSDEKDCQDYNCTNDEFFCFRSRKCIPKELVCDGKKHCFHGEDENRCYWPISIATSAVIQDSFDMFGVPLYSDKGILAYNDHAVWKWSCFPAENEVRVPESVLRLAKRLGFKNYKSYDHLLVIDDEVLNTRQQNYCPGLLVDFSVAHVEDETLIPWRVSIFVNGIFKCLGVLIQGEWVLTDHSCCLKLNTSTDYIVAVLGSDERFRKIIRTYEEQIVPVYEIRCDMKANSGLMHLHGRPSTTRKTKSLGTTLTQGVLKLKKNFLLILEDTRSTIFELNVMSTCPEASSCYKMKNDINFCLNSNSSINFAAIISLSRKNEWIFSGIVVESLTCLTDQTMVTISLPPTESSEKNIFVQIAEFYYRGHRGYRCTLGNQISWENVCDGKTDCRENEDEVDSACQEKKLLIKDEFIKPSCRVGELKCQNGRCVSMSKICDSINDCGDSTDEPKTCSNFTCAAYLNLTKPNKLCDSKQDCEDKSDENIETCPSLCGSPSSFRCNKTNNCIPLDFVCDGERDCDSGEDEENCMSYRIADHNGTEGSIWTRSHGKWKQQCFTTSEMVAFDEQDLCKQFGYSEAITNRTTPATSKIYTHLMRVKLNNFIEINLKRDSEKLVDSTEYCEYLYVSCR